MEVPPEWIINKIVIIKMVDKIIFHALQSALHNGVRTGGAGVLHSAAALPLTYQLFE